MSKPRTVERTVTVTLTLGQIAYENFATGNGPWADVHPNLRHGWEAAAEAVAVEMERQIPEDVAKEIDVIHALWPHLSRAEDVDCLSAWLKDVRETIAAVDARHEAMTKDLCERLGVRGEDAVKGKIEELKVAAAMGRELKAACDRAAEEAYRRDC